MQSQVLSAVLGVLVPLSLAMAPAGSAAQPRSAKAAGRSTASQAQAMALSRAAWPRLPESFTPIDLPRSAELWELEERRSARVVFDAWQPDAGDPVLWYSDEAFAMRRELRRQVFNEVAAGTFAMSPQSLGSLAAGMPPPGTPPPWPATR